MFLKKPLDMVAGLSISRFILLAVAQETYVTFKFFFGSSIAVPISRSLAEPGYISCPFNFWMVYLKYTGPRCRRCTGKRGMMVLLRFIIPYLRQNFLDRFGHYASWILDILWVQIRGHVQDAYDHQSFLSLKISLSPLIPEVCLPPPFSNCRLCAT